MKVYSLLLSFCDIFVVLHFFPHSPLDRTLTQTLTIPNPDPDSRPSLNPKSNDHPNPHSSSDSIPHPNTKSNPLSLSPYSSLTLTLTLTLSLTTPGVPTNLSRAAVLYESAARKFGSFSGVSALGKIHMEVEKRKCFLEDFWAHAIFFVILCM